MLTKGSLQMSNNLSDYDDRLIVVRGRVKELMGDNKSGFDCVFTDCVWQPIGKAGRPLAESPLGTSRNILARIGREDIFRWKLDNPGGPMDRKCEYVFDVVVRDGAFVGLDRVRDWRLASPLIGELKWLRKSHEGVPPQEAFNELTRFVASAFGCPHFNSVGAKVPVRTIQKVLERACDEYGRELAQKIVKEQAVSGIGFARGSAMDQLIGNLLRSS